MGALFLLIAAAVLLSVGEGSNKGSTGANADQVLFYGIIPVLIASVLSGLASSLCQWASQVTKLSVFHSNPSFLNRSLFLFVQLIFFFITG